MGILQSILSRQLSWLTEDQVHCPLSASNPTSMDTHLLSASGEDSLLPSNRFTPRTLLGAGNTNREMMGHLYASQIANAITTKNPEENRTLVLGLGLGKEANVDMDRDLFFKVVDLVLQCL
jgi:proteasome assembly chaperone 3